MGIIFERKELCRKAWLNEARDQNVIEGRYWWDYGKPKVEEIDWLEILRSRRITRNEFQRLQGKVNHNTNQINEHIDASIKASRRKDKEDYY